MASLYGIESDDDCREKIDELLELHRRAEQVTNKESVAALKSRLKEYYEQRDYDRMSSIERAFFRPAVEEAYVRAPKLSSRQTWRKGLEEIEFHLRYYRPDEEKKDAVSHAKSKP